MILQPFLPTFLFPGAIIDGDVSNKFSNFNDIIGPVINGHAPMKSVKSATVPVLIIPAKLKSVRDPTTKRPFHYVTAVDSSIFDISQQN